MDRDQKAERLRDLAGLLEATREFWGVRPFEHRALPWRSTHPELCQFLDGIGLEEIRRLRFDGGARKEALAPYITQVEELERRSVLEPIPPFRPRSESRQHDLFLGVAGRKENQVREFVRRVPDLGLSYIDWCAGKGHLARAIEANSSAATKVLCIEKDPSLCQSGSQLVDATAIEFLQADVLKGAVFVDRESHALALHACGALHLELIRQVVAMEVRALTFAPCCYHRTDVESYRPLSTVAHSRPLTVPLTRDDLRMVGQQTFVAGDRQRHLRDKELCHRLGFDSLQREVRGVDQYLRVPSVPKSIVQGGFGAFCLWVAEKKGILLSTDMDLGHWEELGRTRRVIVERAELVIDLFRRPLEVYLLLDRACHLEESGYEVNLGEFCSRQTTPRNVLIHAQRGR